MRIVLTQTGSKDDLGPVVCCFCRQRFPLGPATCWALTDRSNILMGEVCPACVEAGAAAMETRLERNAIWSEMAANQDREIADEGVQDCPTLDQFLAAETFYGTPMFDTWREYDDAVKRGDVPL